jgi:peptide/nickel transport system permease protein
MTSIDESAIAKRPAAAEIAGRLPQGRGLPPLGAAGGARDRWSRYRKGVIVWLAVGWLVLVVLGALLADVLPLHRYDLFVTDLRPRTAPRLSFTEPLGTDVIGRSTLSRLVFGARQSLAVGLVSAALAMTAGVAIGIIAGYLRGKIDGAIGIVVDAVMAVPALVLLLAISAVGQRNVTTIVAGLALVGTPTFVRLARANTLAVVSRNHVTAARAMGASHARVILRELLPSVILPVLSYAFLFVAYVIVAEGTLSFLGLGIPPPRPSWGGMINEGRRFLGSKPYLVFTPSACIVLTVVSLTIIGDRARRRFDLGEANI